MPDARVDVRDLRALLGRRDGHCPDGRFGAGGHVPEGAAAVGQYLVGDHGEGAFDLFEPRGELGDGVHSFDKTGDGRP